MKCDVYYNLHKKCLSVRHRGKVIKHVISLSMENVKFVVSESGRNRVLKEKRKNVHAVVRGDIIEYDSTDVNCDDSWKIIKYDPYKYPKFITEDDRYVNGAKFVRIFDKKILALELEF